MSAYSGELRAAVITWPSGQSATLTLEGWRVDPPDELLAELLQRDYSPEAMQRRRATLWPELLALCARAAADGLGAEVERIDPATATRVAISQPPLRGFGS